MPSLYGPMVATSDVETAVNKTIAYWVDAYLADTERQHNLAVPTLARPNSYLATYDDQNWPEGQTPAIAVICPGTIGSEDSGDSVGAWFDVTVDAIIVGQTEAEARQIAALYQLTVALLLTQQGSLRGSGSTAFAGDTRFIGWKLELPDVNNRTLAIGSTSLHVWVDAIFDPSAGPLVLPSPPRSPVGTIAVSQPPQVTLSPVTPGQQVPK